jgi:putative DNA primase/helicase
MLPLAACRGRQPIRRDPPPDHRNAGASVTLVRGRNRRRLRRAGDDGCADRGNSTTTKEKGNDMTTYDNTPTETAAVHPEVASTAFGGRLRPLDLAELFALDIKPRGMVLEPIIPEKGLAMLYAARGTGKTHVALGIAYAVATGSSFLKWRAPAARRVLLIDGEMPAAALRERLQHISAGETPIPATLRILAGDLVEHGIGNLASPLVQAELEPWLDGVELLILDNLSSLAAVPENDGDSWAPLQQWLLRLRRRGLSVLIVHHAGKSGGQRGTSRREDVLDTSIRLHRPGDYAATQGARFEVHIDKARGIYGEQVNPFEARLDTGKGTAAWTVKEVEDLDRQRVAALLATGLSVREIAEELDLSKSGVHRLKQLIAQEGTEAGEG